MIYQFWAIALAGDPKATSRDAAICFERAIQFDPKDESIKANFALFKKTRQRARREMFNFDAARNYESVSQSMTPAFVFN